MDLEEERKLVENAKTDPEYFGDLFDIYYPKIVNYIYHRVGDLDVAKDITSITFYKAWHGLPKFEWRGLPFSAWLYRIASNETNTYFRQKKYQPASLDALFEETGFVMPSDNSVEGDYQQLQDTLAMHKDFQLIQRLLLELPLKYQEILSLRFFEKKPITEIALITGKNVNTVKSLLARGTEKVRRTFASHKNSKEQS